jgi:hypothetical protein
MHCGQTQGQEGGEEEEEEVSVLHIQIQIH